MALVDIDLWCAKKDLDWSAFWERAARDGFERPAALLFALVDRWRHPGFLGSTASPHTVAKDVLDDAESLLVQDLEARKDVSAIASLAAARAGGRMQQHPLDRAEHSVGALARMGQLAGRAASVGRSLLDPDTRQNGLATARLQQWMEG